MCSSIFNRDSEMCVQNLQEFLSIWKENYTEDHPLNEQFKKIITRILRKAQGKITSAEYTKWFNELYVENLNGGNFNTGGGTGVNIGGGQYDEDGREADGLEGAEGRDGGLGLAG
jgi:hypothetical protein